MMAPRHKRNWLRASALCLIFLWATMAAAGAIVLFNMPAGSARPTAGVVVIAAFVVALGLTFALQPLLIVATAVAPNSGVGRPSPVRRCPICRAKIDPEAADDRCPVCGGLTTRDAS